MIGNRSSKYEEADNYRKNKQYAQAAPIFEELWLIQPTSYTGWRLAKCLRELKDIQRAVQVAREADQRYPNDQYIMGELISCLREAGELDDAEQIARHALTLYPEDQSISNRLIWVLYDKKLKPAKEDSNLSLILQVADEIMKLNPDGLALQLVVLTVMKVAKRQSNVKWDVVLKWSDKVSAEVFDTKAKEYGGKLGMSDRETYYISRSRALLELERFAEARQQAEKGLDDFPNSFFLSRTAALARVETGDLQGGTAEMRELQKHPRCDWYAKAELAELEYKLANYEVAYRLMCNALQATYQGDEFKLGHLVTLSKIALALNKPQLAAAYVQLAKAIRASREWPMKSDLMQVEQETIAMLEEQNENWPELPTHEKQLSELCHKYWQLGASAGLERKDGSILEPVVDKKFTFIRPSDGTEEVYVQFRNLPRGWQPRMSVNFAMKPSYDRKKGRESFEAVDVRLIR